MIQRNSFHLLLVAFVLTALFSSTSGALRTSEIQFKSFGIDSGSKPVVPPSKDTTGYFIHLVGQGETLPLLSAVYRVDLQELAKLNGIDPRGHVFPGVELKIPPKQ